ncbi:hypothetical protein PLICRDRAFT_39985 [Plicaturopsis crispa FD-325 SS-3]|nr:hypothetical protein PLICRDRAFT_39985 [Plicaturopsis crispa FD-325 SS-3]
MHHDTVASLFSFPFLLSFTFPDRLPHLHQTAMTVTREVDDEQTPLLRSDGHVAVKARTPLPWRQCLLVFMSLLSEPMTSQVIAPFSPQLIRDVGITNGDESQVGYYVGLMQSLFFATEAITVLHWSRFSDRIGRKPVVMIGLFGLSMSMICFGLSRTFWTLVLSRSFNGALNGNVGVLKSMLGEMTDPTNIAQAYSFIPVTWSIGCTLGPIVGGMLSHPVTRFPAIFGGSEFLSKYPYFLPCCVSATYSGSLIFILYFFLKETLASPMPISQALGFRDRKALTEDTTASSSDASGPISSPIDPKEAPVPFAELLNARVMAVTASYAAIALLDIALRAVQPLFFATPIEMGGLGLEPHSIGSILSVFGITNGVFQVLFFPAIHNYFGTKIVLVTSIAAQLPMFLLFPLINYLAKSRGVGGLVYLTVGVQIFLSISSNFANCCINIFITAASPNRASLGATNGIAQVVVSVMRAIGPAAVSSLFSITIKHHLLDGMLVYVVLGAVVLVSVLISSILPRKMWR